MSILIKDMKMPTRCEYCPCFYSEYNVCNAIVGLLVDGKATPPSDCPLVPVPPHGRLIDADALKVKFTKTDANGINLELDRYALKCIDNAPTIIEAEEGETDV